jgi:hypothetical protein
MARIVPMAHQEAATRAKPQHKAVGTCHFTRSELSLCTTDSFKLIPKRRMKFIPIARQV